MSLNLEWENFINSTGDEHKTIVTKEENDFIPSVNDLYISTQTKIAYLNQQIELNNIFWKIEVIPYQDRKCGVIKKQMKVNCLTLEEVVELEKNIEMIKGIKQIDTILRILKRFTGML